MASVTPMASSSAAAVADEGFANRTCTICTEVVAVASVFALQCGHVFHEACVTGWFAHDPARHCPVCRRKQKSMDPHPPRPAAAGPVGAAAVHAAFLPSMADFMDSVCQFLGPVAAVNFSSVAAPPRRAKKPGKPKAPPKPKALPKPKAQPKPKPTSNLKAIYKPKSPRPPTKKRKPGADPDAPSYLPSAVTPAAKKPAPNAEGGNAVCSAASPVYTLQNGARFIELPDKTCVRVDDIPPPAAAAAPPPPPAAVSPPKALPVVIPSPPAPAASVSAVTPKAVVPFYDVRQRMRGRVTTGPSARCEWGRSADSVERATCPRMTVTRFDGVCLCTEHAANRARREAITAAARNKSDAAGERKRAAAEKSVAVTAAAAAAPPSGVRHIVHSGVGVQINAGMRSHRVQSITHTGSGVQINMPGGVVRSFVNDGGYGDGYTTTEVRVGNGIALQTVTGKGGTITNFF